MPQSGPISISGIVRKFATDRQDAASLPVSCCRVPPGSGGTARVGEHHVAEPVQSKATALAAMAGNRGLGIRNRAKYAFRPGCDRRVARCLARNLPGPSEAAHQRWIHRRDSRIPSLMSSCRFRGGYDVGHSSGDELAAPEERGIRPIWCRDAMMEANPNSCGAPTGDVAVGRKDGAPRGPGALWPGEAAHG